MNIKRPDMNSHPIQELLDSLEDDSLLFAEETDVSTGETDSTWKILIVDDDHDIHTVTKLVFQDFSFKGRRLRFLDAYSGDEACRLLRRHPDTAVIFLDVVMESEHAGLNVVKVIREDIGNTLVRIILRTGQPGQAPEQSVIVDYGINGYKSKTELTSQKLFSSLVSALRSFNDLKTIDANRRSMMKILDASSRLDVKSLRIFVSGMLMQLTSLLEFDEDDLILVQQCEEGGLLQIIAACGNYEPFIGDAAQDIFTPGICRTIQKVIAEQTHFIKTHHGVYVACEKTQGNVAVFVNGSKTLGQVDLALVKVFCEKILLAYENCNLLEESQTDMEIGITLLAQLTNPSYPDAIAHARYIGMLSRDIAERLTHHDGDEYLSRTAYNQIARAAMLCNIGNLDLPDTLWNNNGTLTETERDAIRIHPVQGAERLAEHISTSCENGVFALAQKILLTHHERYDGSGYPRGISGKDIPLVGRIVAVAVTFIAMTSPRPYRTAISCEEAVGTITAASGSLFDPTVVRAFLDVVDNYQQGYRENRVANTHVPLPLGV
jgi:response regulator RpfG family c-di-GMP phosphodiesterase